MQAAQGMTVSEASKRLGVTTRAVRFLLQTGRLIGTGTAGRSILIDAASVERLAASGTRQGRAWRPHTAWAALALLSGHDAPWLEVSPKARLKKSLRIMTANDVYILSRDKAVTTRYRAVPEAVTMVDEYLIPSGGAAMRDEETAARFGLTGGGGYAEGYLIKGDASPLVASFGLVEDPQGNVTIHEVESEEAFTDDRAPVAAIAVDLMDSLTTRERSAGIRVLEQLLHG